MLFLSFHYILKVFCLSPLISLLLLWFSFLFVTTVATDAGQLDVYSLKGAVATYSGAMQSQDASPVQELVVGESGEYAVGGTADGSVLLWRL